MGQLKTKSFVRDGIKINGNKYGHPALENLTGQYVHVVMKLDNPGKVYVFNRSDKFICVAKRVFGESKNYVA